MRMVNKTLVEACDASFHSMVLKIEKAPQSQTKAPDNDHILQDDK